MQRFAIIIYCLFAGSTIFSACRQHVPFATYRIEGKHCLMVKTDDIYVPDNFNPYGVENEYSLDWPAKGSMSKEAEQELILRVFGDSISTTVDDAVQRWKNNLWLYEDTKALEIKPVDSISKDDSYTYAVLKSSIEDENGDLVTILTTCETYLVGAAHGLFHVEYLTYDKKKKHIVHLNDLVDTAMLSKVILQAIRDIPDNRGIYDCMFEEFKTADKIAVPDNFIIDSTRSTIYVLYQQYDITPYACGIQEVKLPISWLAKHLEFTPYAKKIFRKDKIKK